MKPNVKQAAIALGMSLFPILSVAAMTAPASARTVCDWDGDDCYRIRPYFDRHDHDWRRDRYIRHEWRERREAERRWYWRHRYDYDYRPYTGAGVWLDF